MFQQIPQQRADRILTPADVLYEIVIPTVCDPEVLPPTMRRLLQHLPPRSRITLSINTSRPEAAEEAIEIIRAMPSAPGICLHMIRVSQPIGFGGSINLALRWLEEEQGGIGEYIVLFNDDLRTVEGWAERLSVGLNADHICLLTEAAKPGQHRRVPRAQWGRVGIVGPMTTVAAGFQGRVSESMLKKYGHEGTALVMQQQQGDACFGADFLSGFCMMLSRECLEDLLIITTDPDGATEPPPEDAQFEIWGLPDVRPYQREGCDDCDLLASLPVPWGERWGLMDEQHFPIAGFEDNDLSVRAGALGWRMAAVAGGYVGHVGHQTFDSMFPEADRGMRNRERFYRLWAPLTQRKDQSMIGVCRVAIRTLEELYHFRTALLRMGYVADGMAILLTNNPLEITRGADWNEHLVQPAEAHMLNALLQSNRAINDALSEGNLTTEEAKEHGAGIAAGVLRAWIMGLLAQHDALPMGQRVDSWGRFAGYARAESTCTQVQVEVWGGEWNERDERNRSIIMAEEMGANWIISFDSDEILERRLNRYHFDRLMMHPDPLVSSWQTSWINCWDNMRLARIDPPWGDGGTMQGGMRGCRFWRVMKNLPQRIHLGTPIGLHCGNSPDTQQGARQVAAIRWLHAGYLSRAHRERKYKHYQKVDPTPDAMLTGNPGGYTHIIREAPLTMEPVVPINGIGLHMLCYEAEDPDDIARLLHTLYGVCDRLVLVWTGEWSDEDQHTLPDGRLLPHPRPGDNPTGPSEALTMYALLYGVEWLHHPYSDDLSACRNAGLDRLFALAPSGLGWAIYLDPDEHFEDPYGAATALVRMAEHSQAWGYMLRFLNPLNSGDSRVVNESESVRMTRLEDPMRMGGRVHESFDIARRKLHARGVHPHMLFAPFKMLNTGLRLSPDQMQAKLRKYTGLLLLELADNPLAAGAWVSLALQMREEGEAWEGLYEECLRRSVACAAGSYLPFQEYAFLLLRRAAGLLQEGVANVTPIHRSHKHMSTILAVLNQQLPPAPPLPAIWGGVTPEEAGFELPDFTPDAIRDAITAHTIPSIHWQDPMLRTMLMAIGVLSSEGAILDAEGNPLTVPTTIQINGAFNIEEIEDDGDSLTLTGRIMPTDSAPGPVQGE